MTFYPNPKLMKQGRDTPFAPCQEVRACINKSLGRSCKWQVCFPSSLLVFERQKKVTTLFCLQHSFQNSKRLKPPNCSSTSTADTTQRVFVSLRILIRVENFFLQVMIISLSQFCRVPPSTNCTVDYENGPISAPLVWMKEEFLHNAKAMLINWHNWVTCN